MNLSALAPSASYWGLDSNAFSRSHMDWISSSEETRASRLAVPLGAEETERVAISDVGAAGVGAMILFVVSSDNCDWIL